MNIEEQLYHGIVQFIIQQDTREFQVPVEDRLEKALKYLNQDAPAKIEKSDSTSFEDLDPF